MMPRGLKATRIVCMAHPRRVAKVAKQIEREIGNMFLFDRRLQEAVCPERRYGVDNAVSGLASVTEVVLSGDLQVAKVYISVFSDDYGKAVALSNLKKLEGYVRFNIGQAMRLRLVPEIRFIEDESLEKSLMVLKLLDQLKAEREGGPAMLRGPIVLPGDRELAAEEEEEEDEEEEGVVDISTDATEDIEAAFNAMEKERVRAGGSAASSASATPLARSFQAARTFKESRPSLGAKKPVQQVGPEGYLEGKYQFDETESLGGGGRPRARRGSGAGGRGKAQGPSI